jgi:uncharacterized glyoxalase superfamily protein PhnB
MPHGSTSLTPHVVAKPAAKALDFYRDVFGARIVDVTRFPGSDLVSRRSWTPSARAGRS